MCQLRALWEPACWRYRHIGFTELIPSLASQLLQDSAAPCSHKTQQCLNTQCVYPAPPRVCYPKRKSPCMKQGFFTGQDRYKLLTPHRTCSARRSLKCPAVWVWPAFSFCRLCCCRLWPWRKSHPRLSHKMQPAQLLLIRLEQSWQHVPTTTPSPSKHRQNTAFLMSLKTAEQTPENFPTQLVTRYRCD